jgi:hypothetical protein
VGQGGWLGAAEAVRWCGGGKEGKERSDYVRSNGEQI